MTDRNTSATGDGSRRHQEVDSRVIQDGEREADGPSELLKQVMQTTDWSFDPLRDPNWQPSREDYASLMEAAKRLVVERDAAERALKLIRDGRCSCGFRFKWTGNQMRCENCGTHAGHGAPGYVIEIAEDALNASATGDLGSPPKSCSEDSSCCLDGGET